MSCQKGKNGRPRGSWPPHTHTHLRGERVQLMPACPHTHKHCSLAFHPKVFTKPIPISSLKLHSSLQMPDYLNLTVTSVEAQHHSQPGCHLESSPLRANWRFCRHQGSRKQSHSDKSVFSLYGTNKFKQGFTWYVNLWAPVALIVNHHLKTLSVFLLITFWTVLSFCGALSWKLFKHQVYFWCYPSYISSGSSMLRKRGA